MTLFYLKLQLRYSSHKPAKMYSTAIFVYFKIANVRSNSEYTHSRRLTTCLRPLHSHRPHNSRKHEHGEQRRQAKAFNILIFISTDLSQKNQISPNHYIPFFVDLYTEEISKRLNYLQPRFITFGEKNVS